MCIQTQRGTQSKTRVICNVHIKYVFRNRGVPSQKHRLSVVHIKYVFRHRGVPSQRRGLSVMFISSMYSDTEKTTLIVLVDSVSVPVLSHVLPWLTVLVVCSMFYHGKQS